MKHPSDEELATYFKGLNEDKPVQARDEWSLDDAFANPKIGPGGPDPSVGEINPPKKASFDEAVANPQMGRKIGAEYELLATADRYAKIDALYKGCAVDGYETGIPALLHPAQDCIRRFGSLVSFLRAARSICFPNSPKHACCLGTSATIIRTTQTELRPRLLRVPAQFQPHLPGIFLACDI